ncbi:hypothetical protein SteCoe_5378 [Stentor coeruleus]|uniref:Uncharacterized protein n=1 Tax=Stentor coeruleus TaxID=5963 RepID=A0A1R2CSG2_9CILI|nr:hypothetical protein SteCoe_5378 [Stentor coeruleus]
MELEIIEKLVKMQDAHNELGNLFGQIALSKEYSGLKKLNEVYNQQNDCINDLREAITQQRNEIRKLKPNGEKIESEPYKLELILSKSQKFLTKQKLPDGESKPSIINTLKRK